MNIKVTVDINTNNVPNDLVEKIQKEIDSNEELRYVLAHSLAQTIWILEWGFIESKCKIGPKFYDNRLHISLDAVCNPNGLDITNKIINY